MLVLKHWEMLVRVKVDETHLLDGYLAERPVRSNDFKIATLKVLAEFNDIKKTSDLLKVPESTLYEWLREWNQKKIDGA